MDKPINKGILYLVPTTLGESPLSRVIPADNLEIIRNIRHFIVEDVRSGRRFLKKAIPDFPLDETGFLIFNEHTDRLQLGEFLEPLLRGFDTGLLSEAGLPCIADPGAEIVREAHRSGIRVVPLSGPSSLFLALMASGFSGQQFCFHGYLPVDRTSRSRKLHEIEKEMATAHNVHMFIEAPYRNHQLFHAILEACRNETLLCIACDLTLSTEEISTLSVGEWKKKTPDIQKRPVVFLLYKD